VGGRGSLLGRSMPMGASEGSSSRPPRRERQPRPAAKLISLADQPRAHHSRRINPSGRSGRESRGPGFLCPPSTGLIRRGVMGLLIARLITVASMSWLRSAASAWKLLLPEAPILHWTHHSALGSTKRGAHMATQLQKPIQIG